MKIEILGVGCTRCQMLEARVRAAAHRAGVEYELVHVRELHDIVERGVDFTPALAIEGEIRCRGRLPSETELTRMLREAASQPA
jgi:small redox-active disulfide protein 2